jgi:uncharacterized protein
MDKINLKVNGQYISANLLKPDNLKEKNPALIFVHGWSSNKVGNILRAQALTQLGFICLTLDLRGHGNSDGALGDFSREDHLEDLKAAYDFLSSQEHVESEKIGIIGASYGGYLSAILTNFKKLKWLVLRVPALYFDKNFEIPTLKLIGNHEEKDAFRSTNLTPKESLALKGITNFKGPILIIESEKDTIIPSATIKNYLKFAPKDTLHIMMKDTPHDLRTEDQQKEYIEILKGWFSKNI